MNKKSGSTSYRSDTKHFAKCRIRSKTYCMLWGKIGTELKCIECEFRPKAIKKGKIK